MSKKTDQEVSAAILSVLKKSKRGPMSIKRVLKQLGLTSDSRRRIRRLLKLLVGEGKVVAEGRGRYSFAGALEELVGVLVRGRGETILVEPEEAPKNGIAKNAEGADALRIHPDERGGALVGDRVRAVLIRRRTRHLSDGRIVEIIQRGGLPIVGQYHRRAKASFVVPDDPEVPGPILVDAAESEASDGDVVAVKVEDLAPRGRPRGKIARVLGEPGELATEVARVALEHLLQREFPIDVEAEAAKAGDDPAAETRVDLREIPHVTIDPPDARDFDDAVYVERSGKGFRLLVSIADVSAYVQPGSALDREALRRGCSVYLPAGVFSMLPSRLSEDLCTLAPGRDRAAVTVELELDAQGAVKDAGFKRSLIRSVARLTYQEVQEILDKHPGKDRAADGRDDEKARQHGERLAVMAECAGLMLERQLGRGALDMDLPESDIQLGPDGAPREVKPAPRYFSQRIPREVKPAPRYFSQRIIEVFMIAANEAVARALEEAGAPGVYRVHPPPDAEKMEVFAKVSESLGAPVTYKKKTPPSPRQLTDYLRSLEGRPVKEVVSLLLLRSLMQARYSANCDGHYGLASPAYLHFTSPIRRYPDLAVHRQLTTLIRGEKSWPHSEAEVAKVSELCSRSERTALAAERAAVSLYQAAYMQERLGETFDGMVAAVFDFGVFVRMYPSGVEGMVHISQMKDDYYRFVEERLSLVGRRTGKTFRMGTRCRVRVESVQLSQARVELSFVGA
jgi:ribonuclease R